MGRPFRLQVYFHVGVAGWHAFHLRFAFARLFALSFFRLAFFSGFLRFAFCLLLLSLLLLLLL